MSPPSRRGDRHGRLYEVTELNGTKTRYDCNVENRLSKGCQNATGTGTTVCGQQRLFQYDHRGFARERFTSCLGRTP